MMRRSDGEKGSGNRTHVALSGLLAAAVLVPLGNVVAQRRLEVSASPATVIDDRGGARNELGIVVGAALLPDSRIAVADLTALNVRVFDSTGTLLATHGRSGGGPSEFSDLMWVDARRDTLVLFDASLRRLTTLNARTGAMSTVRSVSPSSGFRLYPVGRIKGGVIVGLPIRPTSMRHKDGIFRDSIAVHLLSNLDDDAPRQLGPFPWLTHLAVNPQGAERALAVGGFPFGPRLYVTASGDYLTIVDSDVPEVRFFDATGARFAVVRLPWARRPFEEAAIARGRAKEMEKARTPVSRTAADARYDRKYRGPHEPFVSRVIAGPDGAVWVERFRADLDQPAEYLVVTPAGIAATVAVPAGFEPLHATADRVLGRRVDADGAQSLHVHRLRQAQPPRDSATSAAPRKRETNRVTACLLPPCALSSLGVSPR
jgi:hypothetical protein